MIIKLSYKTKYYIYFTELEERT